MALLVMVRPSLVTAWLSLEAIMDTAAGQPSQYASPVRAPARNAPLIRFLILVLNILFACLYCMLFYLSFFFNFPYLSPSLLIISFENKPTPFPGRRRKDEVWPLVGLALLLLLLALFA